MESQSTLVDTARQLLKNRPAWLSYPQIVAKSGVPLYWLKSLAECKALNPRADRLEKLIAYLKTEMK